MRNNNRRQKRRNGNQRASGSRGGGGNINTLLRGQKINPASDVSMITYQPWYPLTLVFEVAVGGVGTDFTVGDLQTAFESQVFAGEPLQATLFLVYKLQSLRFWGALGGRVDMVVANVNPGSPGTFAISQELTQLTDMGDATRRPKVGYVYPARISSNAINDGADTDIIVSLVNTADTLNLSGVGQFHVSILWRLDQAAIFTRDVTGTAHARMRHPLKLKPVVSQLSPVVEDSHCENGGLC